MRSIAQLGEIMQLAYVPADFDGALKRWLEVGAGPFFRLDHVKLDNVRHYGAPTKVDFSMVIGHWGELQIELIRQHDDGASIYKDWRDAGLEGLHHTCILVDDMAEARRVCAEAGAVTAQEGDVPGGGEVIYVDTGLGPGTMVEVLKPGANSRAFFAMMRDAHRGWDGRDPVRMPGG